MIDIRKFLYLIFGEWNGLQNIIAPTLIIFTFDYVSFSKWLIAPLTHQRHYLPVFFYLLALQYILFLTLKARVQWQLNASSNPSAVKGKIGRDLLQPMFIMFHKWLLGLVVVIILVSVFRNIYVYLYQSALPLMSVYLFMFKISLGASLLYCYSFLQFAVPLVQKGKDFRQVQKYYHMFLNKRWKKVLPLFIIQILWIYLSILLCKIVIENLAIINNIPVLILKPQPIQIGFAEADTVVRFLFNTLIFSFGFLLSNLIYGPIVLLTKRGFMYFNILIKPQMYYAAKKKS